MKKVENRKSRFNKWFFIGLGISLAAEAVVSVAVFLIDYYLNYKDIIATSGVALNNMLSNIFMIPSILCILFYLLVFVSNNGAFDAITYSAKLVFYSIFAKNTRQTKLPATYGDYRAMKMAKERGSTLFLLFAAIPFLIVGIIFTVFAVSGYTIY